MKPIRLAFPLACATALFAIGCGGSSFIDGNRDNGLAGTWTLDSMSVDGGASTTCPGTFAASDVTFGCSRIQNTFTEEGRYTTVSADGTLTQTGSFTFDKVVLTTIVGDEDVHAPTIIASSGASYTTQIHQFGHLVAYTFTKNP